MQRDSTSNTFTIGAKMPSFALPNVDGKTVTESYFNGASASLVVFSCNHCPYVKGSEEQLIEVVRKFAQQGLKAVAISANDAVNYPEDSFERMKEKAVAMQLPYPYLYDESQAVAKSFDAACTPECYLFDSKMQLVFHGTINDSPRDPAAAKKSYLEVALSQLLNKQAVDPSFVHPIGCSIKWR